MSSVQSFIILYDGFEQNLVAVDDLFMFRGDCWLVLVYLLFGFNDTFLTGCFFVLLLFFLVFLNFFSH